MTPDRQSTPVPARRMAIRRGWLLLLILVVLGGFGGPVTAQKAVTTPERVVVPDPLTQEAIRDLIAGLDDERVRTLLLQRLKADADRQAALRQPRDNRSLAEVAADTTVKFGRFLHEVAMKLPGIPLELERTFLRFAAERGERSALWFWAGLAGSIATGLIALWVSRRWLRSMLGGPLSTRVGRWQKLRGAAIEVGARFASIAAFVVAAHAVNLVVNADHTLDRTTVTWVIAVAGWTASGITVVHLVLAPRCRDLRLCAATDPDAAFLAWRFTLLAILFNGGFGFASWLDRHGSPYDATWLGFWVNLAVHAILILTIWQARAAVSQIVAGSTEPAAVRGSKLARMWPVIVIGLVVAHWIVVELIVATKSVPVGLFTAMSATLGLLVSLPLLDHGIRALAAGAMVPRPSQPLGLQAADAATRAGLQRVGRVIGLALVAVGLLWVWSVDIITLAEQGVGARLASTVIDSLLIAAVAYGLWEIVRIITDRHIAFERVALGLDARPLEGEMEAESGGAGARLGTLLPLVRLAAEITIVMLAGLAILGELGVNVWPLLAGAGVVGLAIGFGAQALVKDIISGIFFLVDDAFRKGEYIDIGGVKGTVERISLRSMQLRHHNGPLNTVPFGGIRHVTNFSRDWVVMKFSLRLTFDTNADKVRKMVKRLGEELLADPEYGPKFLQPLKSQGVIEMDDSAQIMRIKFMTRPGDQWPIRRVVLNRIREMFETNGIRFASREVVVRVSGSGGEGAPPVLAAAGAAFGAASPGRSGSDDRR